MQRHDRAPPADDALTFIAAALDRMAQRMAAAAALELVETVPPPVAPAPVHPRPSRPPSPAQIRAAVRQQTSAPPGIPLREWKQACANVAAGSAPCSLTREQLQAT